MLCIMYVRAWVHVCTPGACRGLRRPDAAAWELQELELQIVLRHRTGRWEPSLGPLREQYVILSAEPCLQPWGIMIYGHGETHFWVSASGAPEWRWRGTMRNNSCLHTVLLLRCHPSHPKLHHIPATSKHSPTCFAFNQQWKISLGVYFP